jgi:hypothetical protein
MAQNEAAPIKIPGATPRAEDVAANLKAAEEKAKQDGDPKAPDPRGEEKYTFSVEVVDGKGRRLQGTFTNRILDYEERIEVGRIALVLTGGVSPTVLDEDPRWIVNVLAHLSKSLVEKPEWFAKERKNTRVLDKVWREVNGHEIYFRGSDAP